MKPDCSKFIKSVYEAEQKKEAGCIHIISAQ